MTLTHCCRGGLAAGVLVVLAFSQGCSKPKGPVATVEKSATVGTWVEVAPESELTTRNPRVHGGTAGTKLRRKLTIKDDGTFELELLDKDVKPTGKGKATGKWSVDGPYIVYKVTSNDLPADMQDLVPNRSHGAEDEYDEEGKAFPVLRVTDQAGQPCTFKRG